MFALIVLFGGISFQQVARVFVVTVATGLVAGSLGSTLALWREKTFQTLALTALLLVFWMLGCEALRSGAVGDHWAGVDVQRMVGLAESDPRHPGGGATGGRFGCRKLVPGRRATLCLVFA